MPVILTCDPGKIAGFAVWNGQPTNHGLVLADQLPLQEFLVWAEKTVELYAPWDLEVVCEKFMVTAATLTKAKDAHWAFKEWGVLEFLCEKHDVPFELQTPADGKSFAGDDKLRRLEWYENTSGGHRNDAVRHLLVRLVRRGLIPLSAVAE